MTPAGYVIAGLSFELGIGILLYTYARRIRGQLLELHGRLAEIKALRRKWQEPAIPAHVFECLGQFIRARATMSAGRRLAGQTLADKLRTTLPIPDAALAACLHDVLWMAARFVDVPEPMQFRMMADVLVAAATDLCWLELDPATRNDH